MNESSPFDELIPLAQAGFGEFEKATHAANDALALSSLSYRTPEGALEKASRALFERGKRLGPGSFVSLLGKPFFRLDAESRLLLVAKCQLKWSYDKIERTFGLSHTLLEKRLWDARFHLASAPEVAETEAARVFRGLKETHVKDTRGTPPNITCPEFDPAAPWTQRWLDHEARAREKPYILRHLSLCETCKSLLDRTQEICFVAEGLLPGAWSEGAIQDFKDSLNLTWLESEEVAMRAPRGLWRSLKFFFSRNRQAQLLLLLLGLIWIRWILQ